MSSSWPNILLVSSGRKVFKLIEHAVAKAASLSGTAQPLKSKSVPDSLNYFGWCTWDAFYSSVSAKEVQQGLDSLRSGGIMPGNLIIDDGWQMTAVDEDYAETVTTKALRRMKVPQEYLVSLEQDFDQAEQSVLSRYAADSAPGGSEIFNTMPALADAEYGDSLRQDILNRDGSVDDESLGMLSKYEKFRKGVSLELPGIERTVLKLAQRPKEVSLWARLLQRVVGWALGVAQVLVLIVYQYVIDPAGPNSYRTSAFRALAQGPLRSSLLSFFKVSGDFTKRLISYKANGKFSTVDAESNQSSWLAEASDFRIVVSEWKRSYGVKYVYCWHGLSAYWAGVAPSSGDFEGLGARLVYPTPTPGVCEVEPAMAWNPVVLAGIGIVSDPEKLYGRMHKYLAQAGIDGVKVDCQAGVGLVGSVDKGGVNFARDCHNALEDSIALHFPGNHAINCMCHSTENIYQMRDSAIIRASDDFYPSEPASSAPHIAACAYNSLFLHSICQPDWDMFHSIHDAAALHACARAVSGGPVYVSDKIGRHDFAILHKLVLRDGSILRARRAGLPTADCIFNNPLRDTITALKVWNENEFSGVVGAFNLQGSYWDRNRRRFVFDGRSPSSVWAAVGPYHVETMDDVETRLDASGLEVTHQFAMMRNSSGEISILSHMEELRVFLHVCEADMVTIVPLFNLEGCGQSGVVTMGVLGLGNMLNSGGAVQELSPYQPSQEGTRGLKITVRGEGLLVIHSSEIPSSVHVDGVNLSQDDDHGWRYDKQVLQVDIGSSTLQTDLSHEILVYY